MKYEKEIFSIITYAGDANRYSFEALDAVEESDYEMGEKLLAKGRESLVQAHKVQTELLFNECNSEEEAAVPMMMVHAQDHLMNAFLMIDLTEKMISIFRKRDGKSELT